MRKTLAVATDESIGLIDETTFRRRRSILKILHLAAKRLDGLFASLVVQRLKLLDRCEEGCVIQVEEVPDLLSEGKCSACRRGKGEQSCRDVLDRP